MRNENNVLQCIQSLNRSYIVVPTALLHSNKTQLGLNDFYCFLAQWMLTMLPLCATSNPDIWLKVSLFRGNVCDSNNFMTWIRYFGWKVDLVLDTHQRNLALCSFWKFAIGIQSWIHFETVLPVARVYWIGTSLLFIFQMIDRFFFSPTFQPSEVLCPLQHAQ